MKKLTRRVQKEGDGGGAHHALSDMYVVPLAKYVTYDFAAHELRSAVRLTGDQRPVHGHKCIEIFSERITSHSERNGFKKAR